jgi:hypothetical protein
MILDVGVLTDQQKRNHLSNVNKLSLHIYGQGNLVDPGIESRTLPVYFLLCDKYYQLILRFKLH